MPHTQHPSATPEAAGRGAGQASAPSRRGGHTRCGWGGPGRGARCQAEACAASPGGFNLSLLTQTRIIPHLKQQGGRRLGESPRRERTGPPATRGRVGRRVGGRGPGAPLRRAAPDHTHSHATAVYPPQQCRGAVAGIASQGPEQSAPLPATMCAAAAVGRELRLSLPFRRRNKSVGGAWTECRGLERSTELLRGRPAARPQLRWPP